MRPIIWLFVESIEEHQHGVGDRGTWLLELFEETAGVLSQNNMGIVLAITDLDASTAVAIEHLNLNKVRVKLWLTLPDNDGYWTNALNIFRSINRANKILRWTEEQSLKIEVLGIDLELPLKIAKTSSRLFRWLEELNQFHQLYRCLAPNAQGVFEEGIEKLISEHGCTIGLEYFVSPTPPDWFLNPGIHPPKGSRKVAMMYTSLVPNPLRGIALRLMKFFNPGAIPALGIWAESGQKNPGRTLGNKPPSVLSSRDLKVALQILHNEEEIYIFALHYPKQIEDLVKMLQEIQK